MCRADAASPTTLTVDTIFTTTMTAIDASTTDKLSCTPSTLNCQKPSDRYKEQLGPSPIQYIDYPNVLFNLYPVRYFALGVNFTSIPELTLRNTKAKYFLNNMESLITIWEDDGVDIDNTPHYLMIDRENKGGKINIESCIFDYSRFCKGMIAYNYWHYKYTSASWKYYSEPTTQRTDETNLNYYINIKESEFNRLNILNMREQVKTLSLSGSLEVIDPTEPWMLKAGSINIDYALHKFLHKGIVLNLQGFPGSLYISDSTFLYIYILFIIYIERIRI